MPDTKVSVDTLVSALKGNYRLYVVSDTGTAPDSNAATLTQVKQFLETIPPPGGRLTVASATPVVTSSDTGNTTMYYCSIAGDTGAFYVPIYDGTRHMPTKINQLSQLLSDTGESPAAAAAASVYDMYVWEKASVPVLSRGRAWESATARDTGNAIESVDGFYVNKTTFTNGPAARRGLWVGTIRTDPSSAEVTWRYGALAANGLDGFFGVWNAYNRVPVSTRVADSTNSWVYGTAAWRAANNSSTMRVSYVCGLAEDSVWASFASAMQNGAGVNSPVGIGIDTTTDYSGTPQFLGSSSIALSVCAQYMGLPGLGFRFISAIEYSSGGNSTFFGDAGTPAYIQAGLNVTLRM